MPVNVTDNFSYDDDERLIQGDQLTHETLIIWEMIDFFFFVESLRDKQL